MTTTGTQSCNASLRSQTGNCNGVRDCSTRSFTGEYLIYFNLVVAGGGVLLSKAVALLTLTRLEPTDALFSWVIPPHRCLVSPDVNHA